MGCSRNLGSCCLDKMPQMISYSLLFIFCLLNQVKFLRGGGCCQGTGLCRQVHAGDPMFIPWKHLHRRLGRSLAAVALQRFDQCRPGDSKLWPGVHICPPPQILAGLQQFKIFYCKNFLLTFEIFTHCFFVVVVIKPLLA